MTAALAGHRRRSTSTSTVCAGRTPRRPGARPPGRSRRRPPPRRAPHGRRARVGPSGRRRRRGASSPPSGIATGRQLMAALLSPFPPVRAGLRLAAAAAARRLGPGPPGGAAGASDGGRAVRRRAGRAAAGRQRAARRRHPRGRAERAAGMDARRARPDRRLPGPGGRLQRDHRRAAGAPDRSRRRRAAGHARRAGARGARSCGRCPHDPGHDHRAPCRARGVRRAAALRPSSSRPTPCPMRSWRGCGSSSAPAGR